MKNSNTSPWSERRALTASVSQVSSPAGKSTARQPLCLFHVAAPRWILERLVGYSNHLVLRPHDLAQVDVLDRIVRFGERPGASWTVDPRLLERGDELVLLARIAADGVQAASQQQTGVIALDGVDVCVALVSLRVGFAKRLVARGLKPIAIVQRRLQPLGRLALGFEDAVGQKTRSKERNFPLQSRRGVVLDELHRAGTGEERVHGCSFARSYRGEQRLEFDLRERHPQLLHHLATRLGQNLREPTRRLLDGGILPDDG